METTPTPPPTPMTSAPAVAGADPSPDEGTADEVDPAGVDLAAIAAELTAVESALERLDAGGYGTCASCGDPIDDEALAADPTTLSCAAHLRL